MAIRGFLRRKSRLILVVLNLEYDLPWIVCFMHGDSFIMHQKSYQIHSWPAGLRHDLAWLHGIECELLLRSDHTQLIDIWQSQPGSRKGMSRELDTVISSKSLCFLEAQHGRPIFLMCCAPTHVLWYLMLYRFIYKRAASHVQNALECSLRPKESIHIGGVLTGYSLLNIIFLIQQCAPPVCASCGARTSFRLQQHLSFMPRSGAPNRCLSHLHILGYSLSYSALTLPSAMMSQSRLDSLEAAGPLWQGHTPHQHS